MPTDVITFAVDPAAPPEIALAVAGFAEGLVELGRPCDVLVDPWPEAVARRVLVIEVSVGEPGPDRWRLESGPGATLELSGPSARAVPIPFALPALPPRRTGRPRLLMIGAESPRRSRMMLKVFDALRRRSDCAVVVWGDLSDEVVRQRSADEVHPEVDSKELARLLASVDVLVEVADEQLPEAMLLAAIGRAGGIPVVVPEGLGGDRWECTVEVREWGGDAFAEAVLAAAKLGRRPVAAAAARRAAAERLAGALFS